MSGFAFARVSGDGVIGDGEVKEALVQARKPYAAPRIVREQEMEARAGAGTGSPIMIGIDPPKGQIQSTGDSDYNHR